jgi:outer membrane protein assembly factor BamB
MSNIKMAAGKKRGFFRFWFPWFVIVLAGTGILLSWSWPAPELERANRVSFTMMTVMLSSIFLLLWFLFFSSVRWWLRIACTLSVVGALVASIRNVTFSGDTVPIVHFRWDPTNDDILEAQRKKSAGQPVPVLQVTDKNPADFPEYRGRKRDGIVSGPPLARDWKAQPPRRLWKQPVGGGYAGFAAAGNAAVTIEQRRDQEVVVCYDTQTGQERWLYAYLAHFQESLGGPGPRATPTVAGDVYSLGAAGHLACLELSTGREKWSLNILADNDNIHWGMSGSPLVYDQVVVVNPGAQRSAAAGRAVVAYDRATGKQVWTAGRAHAGYSSPMLATLAGQRQIVVFDGEGVAGYDAAGGTELWRYPWVTMQEINVAQPLVLSDDRVFISSNYGVGCAMLHVSQANGRWSVQPLWRNTNMRCKFTSPVAHERFIYGLDDGILCCLDQETGARCWRDGRYGHGQLLLSGDLLVVLSERGRLALVQATSEAFRELGSIPVFSSKTWNCLALAEGKVFLRNDEEMACYDLAQAPPQ